MDVLVANMGTYEGQTVGLLVSVYVDLVYSTEYLLGVSGRIEVFSLGILKGVAVVVYRIRLGGDKGAGSVLSWVSFEGDSDDNPEGIGSVDSDPLGVL